MAGVAAMGVTMTYDGSALTLTSFSVNDQIDNADGSHLGQAVGSRREYVPTFVQREISVDYIGTAIVSARTGPISISGPVSFSGNGTLTASTVSGSVGDLIKGSATWRVA
jgi:hypothetical protein